MSIFSLVGDIFGKKEKGGDVIDTTPSWLQNIGKTLGNSLNTGLADYTPGAAYKGDLNFAGTPTDMETGGLDILKKLLGSAGTGPLFESANTHLLDTLSGKYADPKTSPYIQAMQKALKTQLADQITQERGTRGARGNYFTNAGVQAEGKLRERSTDSLNSIIGQFIQNERNNMLGATDKAVALDKYKNVQLPLSLVGASQQYGGLERTIHGANLESQYQAYLNQRKEQSGALNTAAGLNNVTNIGKAITPKYTVNNDLGNVMDILGSIGSDIGGSAGGAGGASGGTGGGFDISSIIKLLPQLLAMGAA